MSWDSSYKTDSCVRAIWWEIFVTYMHLSSNKPNWKDPEGYNVYISYVLNFEDSAATSGLRFYCRFLSSTSALNGRSSSRSMLYLASSLGVLSVMRRWAGTVLEWDFLVDRYRRLVSFVIRCSCWQVSSTHRVLGWSTHRRRWETSTWGWLRPVLFMESWCLQRLKTLRSLAIAIAAVQNRYA